MIKFPNNFLFNLVLFAFVLVMVVISLSVVMGGYAIEKTGGTSTDHLTTIINLHNKTSSSDQIVSLTSTITFKIWNMTTVVTFTKVNHTNVNFCYKGTSSYYVGNENPYLLMDHPKYKPFLPRQDFFYPHCYSMENLNRVDTNITIYSNETKIIYEGKWKLATSSKILVYCCMNYKI
jgi:hypothetical protein